MDTVTEVVGQFFAELEAYGLAQSLPVAFPGLDDFKPPKDSHWLECIVMVDDNENYGLAADGPTVIAGTFRVGVNTRPGEGVMPMYATAGLLAAAFPKGHAFTGTDARVEEAPTVSGPITETDRVIVPVSIRWRSTQ